MSSVQLVLVKHKKRKNGKIPIAIRLIKNRKPSYIFTGETIYERDWDDIGKKAKKSHSNYNRLNNLLLKKLSEAHAALLETEISEENLTTKQIKKRVKSDGHTSFFEFAEVRIQSKWDEGIYSVSRAEQSILNNIKKFHKKESLSFQDITTSFLSRFKTFCKSKLNQSPRTISNQLIFIRTLFNKAISDGLVDQKFYPFSGDKEKIRLTSGHKIGLTRDEINKIENLELEEESSAWHTKNVWLFAFYFAGIRISDVVKLKWSDFKDGRLFYTMSKNQKPVSLKVPEKAEAIIDLYRPNKIRPKGYVFPFLNKADPKDSEDLFIKSRNATSLFNTHLKKIAKQCGIEKNLSNHIARHSFGNIAGDEIHPLMLQKLYRHSDLKTTINYQANFIHKEADEALERVLNS